MCTFFNLKIHTRLVTMDILRIPFMFGLFLWFITQNEDVVAKRIWLENTKCPDDNIHFNLFTRGNPNQSEILASNIFEFIHSKYLNAQRKNKVIIHGFNESIDDYDYVRLKDEYLRHGDYNIWMIDWSYYAAVRNNHDNISEVVAQMDHVGNCTYKLIEHVRIAKFPKNTFHIIGVGMGAHIASYVSKYLPRPNKIARITALDPAFPFMEITGRKPVHKGDADFVDVLHTNAGFAGYLSPLGDVDFYLNGGIFQPGCLEDEVLFGCNHHRALTYFIESISSDTGFYGWYCTDYMQYLKNECPANEPEALMGEHSNKKLARYGVYIVPTKAKPPYAEGPHLLTNPSYVPVPLQKNIRFNVTDLIASLSELDENDERDTIDHKLQCYRRAHGFKFYNDEVTPLLEYAFGFLC